MDSTTLLVSSKLRSFTGCWTCRLRRKKCDEQRPTCHMCGSLDLPCYFHEEKPDWMDGGARQEQMHQSLKRQVRDSAPARRWAIRADPEQPPIASVSAHSDHDQHLAGQFSAFKVNNDSSLNAKTATITLPLLPSPSTLSPPSSSPPVQSDLSRGVDCILSRVAREFHNSNSLPFGRSDTILISFYTDHVFPFLFPLYSQSPIQGGKSWVLELLLSSPVFRDAALCHSLHWMSYLERTSSTQDGFDETSIDNASWKTVIAQKQKTFETLRAALQTIEHSYIRQHRHGSVRVLASIHQIQRFELSMRDFHSYSIHLSASIAFYQQVLDSCEFGTDNDVSRASCATPICALYQQLGPTSQLIPLNKIQYPSSEQSAFMFVTTFLILEDLLASIVHQRRPRLLDEFARLLEDSALDGSTVHLDFPRAIGCQNDILFCLAQIAALDAHKKLAQRAGNLDMMDLVDQATMIKQDLEEMIQQLESETLFSREDIRYTSPPFPGVSSLPAQSFHQTRVITRLWAHAAIIFLSVVVSGWQRASKEIQKYSRQTFSLIELDVFPKHLLHAVTWPIFIAGCVAECKEQPQVRAILQQHIAGANTTGMLDEALELLEIVWSTEKADTTRDFAQCFSCCGYPVFLL